MSSLLDRIDHLLGHRVEMRSLAIVRALVGAVAVLHLWPLASDGLTGKTYHDRFHQPYVEWLPELGPRLFTSLLVVGTVAAVSMSVGFRTRTASAVTFGVVAYHLAMSTTHMHNNRAYLVAVLVILAMAPTERALSVDAWQAARAGRPLDPLAPAWPLWLLRFECALVYGASGFSKLIDPDWFGGTVTWGRVAAQEAMVRMSVMPDVVADLVLDRSFHSIAAKVIVATELFIAGGLWWRRTRVCAVVAAILFHLMIEVGANVQIFSYLGLAVLVVWADPSMQSRPWRVVQNRRMRSARQPEDLFA